MAAPADSRIRPSRRQSVAARISSPVAMPSPSTAAQTINIADLASSVDSGVLTLTLSGYLGGFDVQGDFRDVRCQLPRFGFGHDRQCLDRSGDRNRQSRRHDAPYTDGTAIIPVGTRSHSVRSHLDTDRRKLQRRYGDNLSAVITTSAIQSGVPEPATWSLLLVALRPRVSPRSVAESIPSKDEVCSHGKGRARSPAFRVLRKWGLQARSRRDPAGIAQAGRKFPFAVHKDGQEKPPS